MPAVEPVTAPFPRPGHRRASVREAGPHPVDVHVGARVRLRRTLLGLPQTRLGAALGISFQQVQKYERGTNRISASMLHHLAHLLDVPIGFFFDGAPPVDGAAPLAPTPDSPDPGPDPALTRREYLELMRYYHRLPKTLRRQVYEMVKAMTRGGRERD